MKKLVALTAVLVIAALVVPAMQSSAEEVTPELMMEVLVKNSPWNLNWEARTQFNTTYSGVNTIVFSHKDGLLLGEVAEHNYIAPPPLQFRNAKTGPLSNLKVRKKGGKFIVEFTLPNDAHVSLTFKDGKFGGTSTATHGSSDVRMVPKK